MPLYEFECDSCHETFEELVTTPSQGDDVECPRCGGQKVRKLQSGFATLSGGGLKVGSGGGCSPGGRFR